MLALSRIRGGSAETPEVDHLLDPEREEWSRVVDGVS
jgi:hypothetical protein